MTLAKKPTCLDGWSNALWEEPEAGESVWAYSAGEVILVVYNGRHEPLTDPLTAAPLQIDGDPILLLNWLPFEASPERPPNIPVTLSLRQVVDQVPATQEFVWGWTERNSEKNLVRYDPLIKRWYDNCGSEVLVLFWLTDAEFQEQCRV